MLRISIISLWSHVMEARVDWGSCEMDFPVAQTVKCLPTMQETQVQSLGREDLLCRRSRPSRARTDTAKRCSFHHRRLGCKSRKSIGTWSNRQIWPWSTKWSRAYTSRVMPRERTGHSKQYKRWCYTWASLDGQYQSQIDYILCWGCRISIQSAKTRLEADCGSDHKILIVKFRLILKKVGKTTRPFRYDLNQILNDYTA